MHCSVTWLLQQKINFQVRSTSLVDGYYETSASGTLGWSSGKDLEMNVLEMKMEHGEDGNVEDDMEKKLTWKSWSIRMLK